MRRLHELQPVVIRAGIAAVDARTVATLGDAAILLPVRQIRIDDRPRSLEFQHGGHLVRLSGRLGPGPTQETVTFTVDGAASVAQRRQSPRLAVDLRVEVHDLDQPGPPVAARTLDFSAGGIRVAGWTAPLGRHVRLAIFLPSGEGAQVALTGRVCRAGASEAAIAFDDGQDEPRDTVGRLVLGVRLHAAVRASQSGRGAR